MPPSGDNQPLGLVLVGLSCMFGRFAFLAPAAFVLCGVVLTSSRGG
jgi:hypothetical protein